MRRLVSADNLLIATLWARVLEDAGVRCEIRNRFIGAALGELPADCVSPEIWILNERDLNAATLLLDELRTPRGLAAWRCPRCAEELEGQFYQCWNCATTQHQRG
jgi:hypothetical protein